MEFHIRLDSLSEQFYNRLFTRIDKAVLNFEFTRATLKTMCDGFYALRNNIYLKEV